MGGQHLLASLTGGREGNLENVEPDPETGFVEQALCFSHCFPNLNRYYYYLKFTYALLLNLSLQSSCSFFKLQQTNFKGRSVITPKLQIENQYHISTGHWKNTMETIQSYKFMLDTVAAEKGD